MADVLPSGDPDPMLRDTAIEPAPKVRYAALGQPLQDTTYSPIDGSIIVARELFQPQLDGGLPTWRLEYTLAGGVPHEVQWAPEDRHGQLTVPLFGRTARNPIPIGGGYTCTPSGMTTGYKNPHIFTTGQWSEGVIPNYPGTGATIDYDFFNASSMSGVGAKPEPLLGDRAFLIDYDTDAAGCRFAVGSAELDSAAVVPGQHSLRTGTWDNAKRPVKVQSVSLSMLSRFLIALGPLHEGIVSGTIELGIAANAFMPALTGVPASSVLPTSTVLPTPVMMTLLQCSYDVLPQPETHQPFALDLFSRMLHVQLVSTRRVLGVPLSSGIETAITAETSINLNPTFPATFPMMITLTPAGKPPISLDGADEQLAIGPATGALALDFVPEDLPGVGADYYDVTLHELGSGALVSRRIYTVTAPHVAIDASILTPGAVYVFEIRSFRGHPSARSGDFRAVSFPYSSAIVFTRTFHTS